MFSGSQEPTPEQFGITPHDVDRVPTAFVRTHRAHLTVALWMLTLCAAFVVLLSVTGNVATAAFFALVATAAASIILLPLALCLLSAGEHAETVWMRRHRPTYAACVAYRDAVAAHREAAARAARTRSDRWFACARRSATRAEILRALTSRGMDVREVDDVETAGFDLTVRDHGRMLLVRCLPGNRSAGPAIGREMTGLMADHGAQAGVIVAASGATLELQAYVERRPLVVVHPSQAATGSFGV